MKFAKRVFFVAGTYGVLVLIPQYFLEGRTGRDFPPPITHPEFYYGFIGVALAWQFLFFIIARDPVRYRAAIGPAIFEKISFVVAVVVLYTQGRIAGPMLLAAAIDFTFAILFFFAYRATPKS